MSDSLGPLSTRKLLFKTFRLYRRHFKLFVGVSILGPAAAVICRLLYVFAVPRPESIPTLARLASEIAIATTIMLLAGLAISSAATVKTVESIRQGQEMRISEAYRAFKGRTWRIIGIVLSVLIRALLSSALFIGLGMIALGLAAALGYNSRVEAGTIGIVCASISVIAATIAAIGIYIRYAVAIQACVVEDTSRKQALERSASLTAADSSRVAAVYCVFIVSLVLLAFVLGAPALLLHQGIALQIAITATTFLAAALTAPVGTIAMSLLYHDQCLFMKANSLLNARTVQASVRS